MKKLMAMIALAGFVAATGCASHEHKGGTSGQTTTYSSGTGSSSTMGTSGTTYRTTQPSGGGTVIFDSSKDTGPVTYPDNAASPSSSGSSGNSSNPAPDTSSSGGTQ